MLASSPPVPSHSDAQQQALLLHMCFVAQQTLLIVHLSCTSICVEQATCSAVHMPSAPGQLRCLLALATLNQLCMQVPTWSW